MEQRKKWRMKIYIYQIYLVRTVKSHLQSRKKYSTAFKWELWYTWKLITDKCVCHCVFRDRWLSCPSCDWCRKPTSPWLTLWWHWLPERRWAGWRLRRRRSRWASGLRGRTLCSSGWTGWVSADGSRLCRYCSAAASHVVCLSLQKPGRILFHNTGSSE